jgi:hypothetical protein
MIPTDRKKKKQQNISPIKKKKKSFFSQNQNKNNFFTLPLDIQIKQLAAQLLSFDNVASKLRQQNLQIASQNQDVFFHQLVFYLVNIHEFLYTLPQNNIIYTSVSQVYCTTKQTYSKQNRRGMKILKTESKKPNRVPT